MQQDKRLKYNVEITHGFERFSALDKRDSKEPKLTSEIAPDGIGRYGSLMASISLSYQSLIVCAEGHSRAGNSRNKCSVEWVPSVKVPADFAAPRIPRFQNRRVPCLE